MVGRLRRLDVAPPLDESRQHRPSSGVPAHSLVHRQRVVACVADEIVAETALTGLRISEQTHRMGLAHRGAKLTKRDSSHLGEHI
jgi:hypothetical protein